MTSPQPAPAALSAASTFLKTCSLCARMSPLPTTVPLASQLTWPET
jgi:hypothetical protein